VQKWTPFLLQHGASQVDAFDDKELLNIENVFHRKPMLYSSKYPTTKPRFVAT